MREPSVISRIGILIGGWMLVGFLLSFAISHPGAGDSIEIIVMAPLFAVIGFMTMIPAGVRDSTAMLYGLLTLLVITLICAVAVKSKRGFWAVVIGHLLFAIVGLVFFSKLIRSFDDAGSGG